MQVNIFAFKYPNYKCSFISSYVVVDFRTLFPSYCSYKVYSDNQKRRWLYLDLFLLHNLFVFRLLTALLLNALLLKRIFSRWEWILAAQDQRNKTFIFASGIYRLVVIKWVSNFSGKRIFLSAWKFNMIFFLL